MNTWPRFVLMPVMVAMMACAPTSLSSSVGREEPTPPSKFDRTLVIVGREVTSLAQKRLQGTSGSIETSLAVFNAGLDRRDETGDPAPYLAETLPQLNTEGWRVYPDGRMETRYQLKPNLTWHDGTPLTADDFRFAWQVYATPAFGTNLAPISFMENVLAPDARTLVIQWRQLYPEAGTVHTSASGGAAGFPPLPRHLLEQSLQELDAPAFAGLPFWMQEYVGVGPFQLERIVPGAFIEASAFNGYVLGRPRIDRLRISFIADPNTLMANMLAGEAHFIPDFLIGSEEARTLEQEWAKRGMSGVVNQSPTQMRLSGIQFRPGVVNPALLGDVRIRKALAHAVDNQSALDAMTDGKGRIVPVPIPHSHDYWNAAEGIPTYRYDPAAARRLLEEAGLVRGGDGFYQTANGTPFRLEYGFIHQAANERENAIFVDSLRRSGVDAMPRAYTAVELRDPQVRNLYPSLFTGTGTLLTDLSLAEITAAENRWQGRNRGGWEHQEFSRLQGLFEVTLEPSERSRLITAMAGLFYEELPGIPHYLTTVVNAWSPDLLDVVARSNPNIAPLDHVHKWAWR